MRGVASPVTLRPRASPVVRSKSNAPGTSTFHRQSLVPPRLHLRLSPAPVPSQPPISRSHRLMPPTAAATTSEAGSFTELTSAADFATIASADGRISVIGFGSLLSERSARSTFPELEGFRVAALRGFRRVFAHAAPIFFDRGIAIEATKEFSSLSVEQCEGEMIVVTVFEIKEEEVPAFIERENEFRFLVVVPEGLDQVPFPNPAVVCARYSDEEYFQVRCKGSKEIYNQHYGRYNIDKIWRDDILPCRLYLRHCVLAAKNLGEAAYSSFLDHTYLGDRKTTIREYLATTGAGIMEEEPPESLKSRYGG
ncbi:uncharacterized protein LOC100832854 [Brachypodium distachyon]|uniref:Uncharacterized protein n=1 Tax=Brachypodium distachyon TaxID=15368 RepID=I1HK90_BRADI|nr:uncharacterized protein LOC100832854 [Brachypodium distachyon]KQK06716.1 hypothetical protein BRADI_2g28000v3 [Brachypodium distachyon]|eukprot:XP_003566337.1 uncharacterized protein LOC100832854 [Brachypodium distachyon]